jgi:hypothetical protein
MASPDRFALISDIKVDEPDSWLGKIFLTLDLDWAADAVIEDTIDIVEAAGAAATWFVTHDTPVLERLRSNPRFELGIHPNFNFLLLGDGRNGADSAEVVDRLLAIVPEAKAVRSHSVTQSSQILDLFVERGLTHDCNHFIPEESGITLQPWRYWGGMVKVPYFWEDDVYCLSDRRSPIAEVAARDGLRVFDFHPIHIFLNTEDMRRYDDARPHLADIGALLDRRAMDCLGARQLLAELLELG